VIKRLLEICQTLTPMPRIIGGKKILNLIPPGSPNKGDALLAALRSQSPKSARHAFYAGDDETDEDVFRLVGTHPITTLRVGFEPSSRAQAFITEQHQILKILHGQIASLLR
jgi:trehalose 6-phosphate phosphatase